MNNRVDYFIKKSGLTVQQVADAAGYTRDAINRIKAGTSGLNQNNMESLARVLECHPSELLPLEWQKPSDAIDVSLLQQAIEMVNEAIAKDEHKPTVEQTATSIAAIYEKLQKGEGVGEFNLLQLFGNSNKK